MFDVRTVEVTPENWAVVERMAHWQAGWYMFLDHPWLGVGAGNYGDAYPDYFVGPWPEALGHAHNYYLNMLAELGVHWRLLVVADARPVFPATGRRVAASRRTSRGSFWRALLAGCLGGLVVFCVHNMFDSLFVHSVNVQIGVLLGLGLVAVRQLRRPGCRPGPMTTRTPTEDLDPCRSTANAATRRRGRADRRGRPAAIATDEDADDETDPRRAPAVRQRLASASSTCVR